MYLHKVISFFRSLRRSGDGDTREKLAEISDLDAQGRLVEALAIASELQRNSPRNPAVLHTLAVLQARNQQLEESLVTFGKAIQITPKSSSLRFDYGNALRLSKRQDEAELEYRIALSFDPDSFLACQALGHLMVEMKRPKEAVLFYSQALSSRPQDLPTISLLALTHHALYDFQKVQQLLLPLWKTQQLGIEESYALGTSLLQLGEIHLAEKLLNEALTQFPQSPAIRFAIGFKHLFAGNWGLGFALYELRREVTQQMGEAEGLRAWYSYIDTATLGVRQWTEGDCTGKHLLVWAEQGLGDILMALRFVKYLRQFNLPASLTFLCPSPISRLAHCFEGIDFVIATPEWQANPRRFDLHCSIMSLPHLTRLPPEKTSTMVPYIAPLAVQSAFWQERLAPYTGPRIGIVWAGGIKLTLDAVRSISLREIGRLIENFPATFFSLQKDPEARFELQESKLPVIDLMDHCEDLLDTAGLIQELDLVISVDTSVAHLAGAMGKPVWLMNRFSSEWRWGRGRTESFWYPSMLIFTQKKLGDWGSIVDSISEKLSDEFPLSQKF